MFDSRLPWVCEGAVTGSDTNTCGRLRVVTIPNAAVSMKPASRGPIGSSATSDPGLPE